MSNGYLPSPHPFHMVHPSPWPMVGAGAAFVLALGLVLLMHDHGPWGLIAGFILVLFTMAGWWRDVIRESVVDDVHTSPVRHGLRVGMGLFILSEVMFFAAFFWAFFHNALQVSPGVTQWPPPSIQPFNPWGVPFLNTLILLSSGMTVNWAHHAVRADHRRNIILGLAVTVALGALFLSLQAYEYGHAAFAFREGIYPSVFYMATGFHGFHVLVGVCFLTVNLGRALRGQFLPDHHVGFEAAAWYWHFVDVVWLFLFVWIYWWGGS
ncbi:MAG: cytochrome c oxidase subunit III [Rhodospirillaceae bacterium]|nr:MAG: cytochrome c oxidase subunit III [Rhodospirillaceae bacterium]